MIKSFPVRNILKDLIPYTLICELFFKKNTGCFKSRSLLRVRTGAVPILVFPSYLNITSVQKPLSFLNMNALFIVNPLICTTLHTST